VEPLKAPKTPKPQWCVSRGRLKSQAEPKATKGTKGTKGTKAVIG